MTRFNIKRDANGLWSAWPVFGGEIIGPCSVLDTLFHIMTQRYAAFTAEISWP